MRLVGTLGLHCHSSFYFLNISRSFFESSSFVVATSNHALKVKNLSKCEKSCFTFVKYITPKVHLIFSYAFPKLYWFNFYLMRGIVRSFHVSFSKLLSLSQDFIFIFTQFILCIKRFPCSVKVLVQFLHRLHVDLASQFYC